MARSPIVRPPRVLLLVSAAAAAFSVLATLVSESRAALQSGLVASAAFLGYVLLAGRAAPRVRSALATAVGLFALVMAVQLGWLAEQPMRNGWMEPFYAPLDGGGPGLSMRPLPPGILDHWRQLIDRERIAGVGLLLGVLCLAVAVRALPARQRPKRTLLARIVAALLLVVVAVDVWDSVDDAPLSGALVAGWPALLATLVAAAVLALSAGRADRRALVPLGALLVAVTAAVDLAHITAGWSSWRTAADHSRDAFLQIRIAVAAGGWADVSAAVRAALAFAGPALLAIGALHASRDSDLTEPR